MAEVLGLPALRGAALPPGSAEYRFELGCGACLPHFLVRLVRDSADRLEATAALLWFAPPAPDDTSAAAKNMRETPELCAGPLRPAAGSAPAAYRQGLTWCPVQLMHVGSLRRTLMVLDSLGMAFVGKKNGYSPTPPGFARDTVLPDGRRTIIIGGGGCQDIGGVSLEIEARVGEEYRQALFWCLETPVGDEQQRAAAARRVLVNLLGRD